MSTLSKYQDFLIKRASQEETYLGYSLMKYARSKKVSIREVKEELGCNDTNFLKLVLCRHISTDALNFQQQAQKIADYVGLDVAKLSRIIAH